MRVVVLLALLLGACTGIDTQGEGGAPVSATPSSAAAVAPERLTCEGDSSFITFDYGGDPTFTRLLTTWSEELGRPWVDHGRRTIWFLREDGTAHTALAWTRARQVENGREWFVDGYEQCDDAAEWRDVRPDTTPIELVVGHCWVEPVTVDGRTWDVTREDQFGWRGGVPKTFVETGELSVAGDVAVYAYAGGRALTLVPEGDPWALVRRGCK